MSWNDADYFRGRANCERAMAACADNPAVAEVHLELAARYEQLIDKDDGKTLPKSRS